MLSLDIIIILIICSSNGLLIVGCYALSTSSPTNVAVAGASGRTGSLVVKDLLGRGVNGKANITLRILKFIFILKKISFCL